MYIYASSTLYSSQDARDSLFSFFLSLSDESFCSNDKKYLQVELLNNQEKVSLCNVNHQFLKISNNSNRPKQFSKNPNEVNTCFIE